MGKKRGPKQKITEEQKEKIRAAVKELRKKYFYVSTGTFAEEHPELLRLNGDTDLLISKTSLWMRRPGMTCLAWVRPPFGSLTTLL